MTPLRSSHSHDPSLLWPRCQLISGGRGGAGAGRSHLLCEPEPPLPAPLKVIRGQVVPNTRSAVGTHCVLSVRGWVGTGRELFGLFGAHVSPSFGSSPFCLSSGCGRGRGSFHTQRGQDTRTYSLSGGEWAPSGEKGSPLSRCTRLQKHCGPGSDFVPGPQDILWSLALPA